MSRHFGIPSATGSTTLRGDKSPSPHTSAVHTHAGSNVIPFSRLSERQAPQLNCQRHSVVAGPFIPDPIDHREFGSWFFTIAFFAAPSVFVGAAVFVYATLIA